MTRSVSLSLLSLGCIALALALCGPAAHADTEGAIRSLQQQLQAEYRKYANNVDDLKRRLDDLARNRGRLPRGTVSDGVLLRGEKTLSGRPIRETINGHRGKIDLINRRIRDNLAKIRRLERRLAKLIAKRVPRVRPSASPAPRPSASPAPKPTGTPRPKGGGGRIITPKGVGVLVAVEGAIYLVEISHEFNQLATGPISDPDFTFLDEHEAELIGINPFSDGYWNGVWDYWNPWYERPRSSPRPNSRPNPRRRHTSPGN